MNSYFQMALQHTAFFTLISVGTVMLLSVFLTFFLANSSYKLHAPFMLPVLLPTVAVCLIWNVLFGRGSLLESLGIPVEASLYTLFLWKNTGLQVVFLLSALAQLPREPMEAAAIDGAGTLGRFWYVTLPQLFPTLLFCCFYVMMCSFRIFREAYLLYPRPQRWRQKENGQRHKSRSCPKAGDKTARILQGPAPSVSVPFDDALRPLLFQQSVQKPEGCKMYHAADRHPLIVNRFHARCDDACVPLA